VFWPGDAEILALVRERLLRGKGENASRSGQESPDGGSPLSLRSIDHGHLTGPCSREIDRWSDKESEVLFRTRASNLLVEFERFSGQVSPHVEQYQVIHMGLP